MKLSDSEETLIVSGFSVLMSVHASEQPGYLAACLDSLIAQSLPPTEVVLVEDGPLGQDLLDCIERYRGLLPLVSVKLPENIGLARALNVGLTHCSHDLVARMDTDDICRPDRFECQIASLREHPEIDVVGAMIEEFDPTMQHSLGVRKLPLSHAKLSRFAKIRCPMSHPSVVFRKQAVLEVGGYPAFRKAQDYALWSLMLTKHYRMQNLDKVLLSMRAGNDMLARRGKEHLKFELAILKFQRSIGFLNYREYLLSYTIRSIVRRSPMVIKKMLYRFAR